MPGADPRLLLPDGVGAAPSRNGSLLLIAGVLAAALLAGSAVAIAGALAGTRAIYLVAVPGVIAIGAVFTLTRAEPLRFAFLVLFAALPFVNILVPPGRLNFTVFDVATVLLACGLLLHKAFAARGSVAPLFPAPSLGLIWLLLIPCAVLARYPFEAVQALLLMFAAYVFFWFVLEEIKRPAGLERLVAFLSMIVLVVAAGLAVDYFFQINLSMRGSNFNQQTEIEGGGYIWRAGGFFQDPQKAGGFLAALLAFKVVLIARGRIHTPRLRALVLAAIIAGAAALFLTVSRAAIVSFLLVSVVALLAANRWPVALKLAGIGGLTVFGVSLVAVPGLWMSILPETFASRLANSHEEFMFRVTIWLDTWDMFANQPLTGIGFSGFQQYLMDTRPGVTNYYDIGVAEGVTYIPDQPESGYFKILYEGGLLGSLAAVILIVSSLSRAVSAIVSRQTSADERTQVIAALAGLAVFAMTFATLFTTTDPRMLALFLILLAVIWQPSAQRSTPAARR